MGHLFIVHGDIRKLYCDAWLLPCDSRARPNRHWLEWPSGDAVTLTHREPPVGWHPEGLRTFKAADWPSHRPQPWFTNVGLDKMRPLSWFIEGAVQFANLAGQELAGQKSRCGQRARPLLALPIVGTGFGGAQGAAGDVVRLLIPALTECVNRYPVDIALIAYEESSFAAAQAYRRSGAGFWPELSPALRAHADRLAVKAGSGELVLFLGAGVSSGAGLPQWGELIARLAKELGIEGAELFALQRLDYMDQAHIFEQRLGGEEVLRQKIADAVRSDYHSLGHALLASLPISEVVTTNYDQLFELAYGRDGQRSLAVLPHAPRQQANGWILKMHGSVERPRDIVLTRRDYMRYDEQRAALAGIVQAQLITKQMLFVGFSMSDANFLRIADAVRRALRTAETPESAAEAGKAARQAFGVALALTRNPLLQELWRHDLEWVAMDDSSDSGSVSIADAARRLDIFLDYLLAQASSTTAHLLDRRFDGVLSDKERALRGALERFLETVPEEAWHVPAWRQVVSLVQSLGGYPIPKARRS